MKPKRKKEWKNVRSLIAEILDVLEILGEFAVAGDDGAFNDFGEFVVFKRPFGVRLEDVENVRKEQITEKVGGFAR